jgi:hypothetical protein
MMFSGFWVYVIKGNCGTFARVVAAFPPANVVSFAEVWEDDAVFQGAGWVN